MPSWVTLIGGFLKLIGLVSAAEAWLERYEAKQQGRKDQKAADDAATVKQASEAQKIGGSVRGMSDAELDDRLRRPASDR